MTKRLLISLALSLLVHLSAFALTLHTLPVDVQITTQRVIVIAGSIDRAVADGVEMQLLAHQGPGPIVLIVHSGGGSVTEGARILGMLMAERIKGTKLICVGVGMTHSMAFNIMSYCDSRYMTLGTTAVAHKVAIMPSDAQRWTVKHLREVAKSVEKYDEPWRTRNAKEMHLSLTEYDKAADDEREWTAEELMRIGYINGFALLEE